MKQKNLQPWLDYFDMLRLYEKKDFLEVLPEKHEAYITQPALHAMSQGDDPRKQMEKAVQETAKRIRVYAGWKSCDGIDYLDVPFALHVVSDEQPHDLLYTILLTRHRVWWRLWKMTERIEVIPVKQT